MSRRGNIAKRDVLADPLYNSKMVTRQVNITSCTTAKRASRRKSFTMRSISKEKTGNDPLESRKSPEKHHAGA